MNVPFYYNNSYFHFASAHIFIFSYSSHGTRRKVAAEDEELLASVQPFPRVHDALQRRQVLG